jgi:hypothetical protein
MNRMITELSELLGLKAAATLRDQVAALGESMESFPMARIWELTQRVGEQIPEHPSRIKFLRSMAREIRAIPGASSAPPA